MRVRAIAILLILPGLLVMMPISAQTVEIGSLEQIERELESERYPILAKVQADPHNLLADFTTDGCSGGLSVGWRFLASKLPAFARKFGDKPPYEACCVQHDRAYWRGGTQNGFSQRLQADRNLQQCVEDFGVAHSEEFAKNFDLSPDTIQTNFRIVAALMYRAVRVGGQPCTTFSWRWGYGWPQCPQQDE